MYKYDNLDQSFLQSRSAQFRDQVQRRLSGALSEDEFKPLRLSFRFFQMAVVLLMRAVFEPHLALPAH